MSEAVRKLVERHANAMDDLSRALEKDNIGLHAERGFVPLLKRMSSAMRADAIAGRIPHAFTYAGSATMYASGFDRQTQRALAVVGLSGVCAGDRITVHDLDATFEAAGDAVSVADKIAVKRSLMSVGILRAEA